MVGKENVGGNALRQQTFLMVGKVNLGGNAQGQQAFLMVRKEDLGGNERQNGRLRERDLGKSFIGIYTFSMVHLKLLTGGDHCPITDFE